MSLPHLMKVLSPGRVIVVYTLKYHYCLAIVLQDGPKHDKTFKCLMLCDIGDDSGFLSSNTDCVIPHELRDKFYQPDGEGNHVLVDVSSEMVIAVLRDSVSINARRIISDFNQRQLPRFR